MMTRPARRRTVPTLPRARAAITPAQLMGEAERARRMAHAPYSRFAVGAALLTAGGRVFYGCNVENASYGLTTCAERTAVFSAVAAGERSFAAIAVTAREGHGAPPCGACRQVLHEFAPDLWVYWRDDRGRMLKRKLSVLLPKAFVFERGGTRARSVERGGTRARSVERVR
jgi:cytidine deaminase